MPKLVPRGSVAPILPPVPNKRAKATRREPGPEQAPDAGPKKRAKATRQEPGPESNQSSLSGFLVKAAAKAEADPASFSLGHYLLRPASISKVAVGQMLVACHRSAGNSITMTKGATELDSIYKVLGPLLLFRYVGQ